MKKKTKIYWPFFLMCYLAMFMASDFIITGKASFPDSPVLGGYYFKVEGIESVKTGVLFLILSLAGLIYFLITSLRVLRDNFMKKKDIILLWIFNYLLFPIIFIIITFFEIKLLSLFLLVAAIIFTILTLNKTNKLNKEINSDE